MNAAAETQLLCRLEDIALPGSKGFRIGSGTSERAIFVVRSGSCVAAFENHCPHVGSPLDWVPGRFLDYERKHILCATHGARFTIPDGTCFEGPCLGKALTVVPIRVEGGSIYLAGTATAAS